ncbi:FBP domain-containing protein [Kutzneria sp. CA-103260]|uniref:FBP domain-containing protein n=1 Tax=Kutzneria sp. CA-103260 TaxID=2802641 RepID=UPI001BA934FB|nr:FBP domain-containing protein [Kutzneria sp. CA-103260]QUQ62791.1 FBP domain-containing protein [Kutzneria sp. CA-103260]
MEPLDETTIRASFVNCSKGEARRLNLPGRLGDVAWEDLDFLGWRDPKAPANAYLVLPRDGKVVGLAMRAAAPHASQLKSSLCALCQTTHAAADVSLFAARRIGNAGKLGNTVGTYICADLACSLYIRGKRKPSTTATARVTSTVDEEIQRTMNSLNKFVDEVLTDNA